jgi:uncharacterized membrane protein YjdF
MSPILVILNALALVFAVLLWCSIEVRYQRLFITAATLPIIIFILIIILSPNQWDAITIFMLLLRGVFVFSIISGSLTCYLFTKIDKNKLE